MREVGDVVLVVVVAVVVGVVVVVVVVVVGTAVVETGKIEIRLRFSRPPSRKVRLIRVIVCGMSEVKSRDIAES